MLLIVAFVLIAWLWSYARAVSGRLQELHRFISAHELRLSKVEERLTSQQQTAATVSAVPVRQPPYPLEKPVPPDGEHLAPPPPQMVPTTPIFQLAWTENKFEDKSKTEPIRGPLALMPSIEERIKTAGGWEELVGGNLLNKIGALLLVIGIALFLSYSFAHMGPTGVAFTAVIFSIATLLGGVMIERREVYRVFARGLIAAGWAGLYFSAYAIHTLPAAKIIDNPVAGMSLMVLVAAGMVAQSLRYRVQPLTSLAYGCVFAALALSDQNTLVAIALIPLAASMLFLARRFQWYGTSLFCAAATYVTFLTRPTTGAPLWTIQMMLLIFWLMFEAFDLLRLNAGAEEWPGPGALFGLNALAGLGASAAIWYRLAPDSMWQFCSVGALLYLSSAWIRFAMKGRTMCEFSLMISALLAALAIFAGVPGLWISLGLIAEAEVLFLVGRYLNLRFSHALSMMVFAAAGLQIGTRLGAEPSVILGAFIDTWAPPLVVMAMVFYLNRYLSPDRRYFGFLASASAALVMGVELPWRYAGVAVLIYGVLLMELGIRRDLIDFRLQGYGLTALGAIGAGLSFLDPLHSRNVWTYAFAAVLSQAISIRAVRSLASLPELERRALRIGGSVGTAGLSALLATRLFSESYWGIAIICVSVALFEFAWAALPSEILIPSLIVNAVGVARLLVEHVDGIRKGPEPSVWIAFVGAALTYYFLSVRLLGDTEPEHAPIRVVAPWLGSAFAMVAIQMLLPTAYVCIAFGALALLMTEVGFAAEAPHLVWHGRAISLVSAAALLSLSLQSSGVVIANCAGLALVQLVLLFRSRKLPLSRAHGYLASLIVAGVLLDQVSGGMLTLSWSLEGIGLLALGFVAGERPLRLSGLTMLLLCIGKAFFYDLRNLDTLSRIFSFIGLGAILLLVSWIYARFKEHLRNYF
jgi:hypothetical protein